MSRFAGRCRFLTCNGTAPIGDLRYLADTKLNNLATPIAKAQLAAALRWNTSERQRDFASGAKPTRWSPRRLTKRR